MYEKVKGVSLSLSNTIKLTSHSLFSCRDSRARTISAKVAYSSSVGSGDPFSSK